MGSIPCRLALRRLKLDVSCIGAEAETAYDLVCCSVDSIPCCLASRRLSLHASRTACADAETAYDLACGSVDSIPCCLASLRLSLHASCTAGAKAKLLMISRVARWIQYLVALLRGVLTYMCPARLVQMQRLLMISHVTR